MVTPSLARSELKLRKAANVDRGLGRSSRDPWLATMGLVELDVLAARIVSRLHRDAARDLVNVTTLDEDGALVVRATLGSRTNRMIGMRFPVDVGIGGLAVSKGQTICVPDYEREGATREFRDVMVGGEGIRAAVAVPLVVNSQALGVLFLGRRDDEPIKSAHLRRLQDMAAAVAPLVGASMQLVHHLDTAITEERLRLANQLHDQVVPLLFFIGATARRAREKIQGDEREIVDLIESIERMAASANGIARGSIGSLGPMPEKQLPAVRIRATCDRLAALTEIPISLDVQGVPVVLTPAVIDTLDAAASEALNNVAKHAPTASVVVTLVYLPGEVSVTIMDDGVGLPPDFTLSSITDPGTGDHYGLASLSHRLRLQNGSLDVASNEDGGVTVKASLPTGYRC